MLRKCVKSLFCFCLTGKDTMVEKGCVFHLLAKCGGSSGTANIPPLIDCSTVILCEVNTVLFIFVSSFAWECDIAYTRVYC